MVNDSRSSAFVGPKCTLGNSIVVAIFITDKDWRY